MGTEQAVAELHELADRINKWADTYAPNAPPGTVARLLASNLGIIAIRVAERGVSVPAEPSGPRIQLVYSAPN